MKPFLLTRPNKHVSFRKKAVNKHMILEKASYFEMFLVEKYIAVAYITTPIPHILY